jgi:hypothetical protein
MIPCTVERHYGAWLVEFEGGASLLLQSDYDQAAFAVARVALAAPAGWDGLPSKLGPAWWNFDPSTIEHCPADYADLAVQEEGER